MPQSICEWRLDKHSILWYTAIKSEWNKWILWHFSFCCCWLWGWKNMEVFLTERLWRANKKSNAIEWVMFYVSIFIITYPFESWIFSPNWFSQKLLFIPTSLRYVQCNHFVFSFDKGTVQCIQAYLPLIILLVTCWRYHAVITLLVQNSSSLLTKKSLWRLSVAVNLCLFVKILQI